MYTWDNVATLNRVRREHGSWGLIVTHKKGGKNGTETILVNECGTFPLTEETRMAEKLGSVGISRGTTINMKNFESARVDCWCSLPCAEENVNEVYEKCYDFVTDRVKEEAAKCIAERDGDE
jgi:hypothetical protein